MIDQLQGITVAIYILKNDHRQDKKYELLLNFVIDLMRNIVDVACLLFLQHSHFGQN